MSHQSIERRLSLLEQKQAPTNSHVVLVRAGEDRDEVLAQFKIDNNVQGGIIHVVRFKSRENRI